MKRPRKNTNTSSWPLPCVFTALCNCARNKWADNVMLSFLRVRLNRLFVCLSGAPRKWCSGAQHFTVFPLDVYFSLSWRVKLSVSALQILPSMQVSFFFSYWCWCVEPFFGGWFCFQVSTVTPHRTGRTGFPSLLQSCTRGMTSEFPLLCSTFQFNGLKHSR